MKSIATLTLSFVCALSSAALAQNTLGEFLDMGAVPVLKAEWETLLPASKKGRTPQGSDVILEFAAGGKLSGIIERGGQKSRIWGSWTVDETGNLCIDEYFEVTRTTWKDCGRLYRLNGKYYRMTGVTERSAELFKPLVLVPFTVKK